MYSELSKHNTYTQKSEFEIQNLEKRKGGEWKSIEKEPFWKREWDFVVEPFVS